ncbi:BglG family transcription antiterminator [Litchfieldia alkalitelluris]|uniref:BglG family transcription antiterminator n=1 Tax=Litchfieldia alkalitelluris TaxID=304268 RepID=UPI00099805BD|nr:BglG family transcription antiterminator [Litchfieldia alkalitelluris]
MYISARERKILEFLLLKKDETTVKDLSNELTVSPRTVHRDLKGVEDILKEYDLHLNKKSGIGIQIVGEDENKQRLEMFLFNLSHNEYTPEERQTIILSELLDSKDPVKLMSLANDLNVTIATVSHDLDKVEERLAVYDLKLLRKRGYGVEIIGSESAKRKTMSKLIIENIEEFEFISLIKENIQRKSTQVVNTVTDRLLGLVDKKKLLVIEKQIDQIKDDLPYEIADSAYIGLVVHLALAIERIQQGEEINFDQAYLKSLQGTIEYKAAGKIVAGLAEILQIEISIGEIGYITMHLMGAKHRNDHDDLLEDTSLQVGIVAQKMIRYVSDEIQVDLTSNLSLFQGLVAHLRPALHRIRQKMGITNPLLSKIENDYTEMFTILDQGVKEIFPDMQVPKEEIGYLVMHFASALLNRNEVTEIKTLVVCSSGIGTSKMLSTKLEQAIPGLKAVNASLFQLETLNVDQFDAIISTIPLKNFKGDYLFVSPLLSQEDIENIKHSLVGKHNVGRYKTTITKARPQSFDFKEYMINIGKIKNYSTAVHQILCGFNLLHLGSNQSIENALTDMVEKFVVTTSSKDVINDLLEREKSGGLGIPGTTLALYHTRSDSVLEPSFTIGRLNESLVVKGMDDSDIEINTILLMLSPKRINEEAIELLSAISSLIIRDDQTIELFQIGKKEKIIELIALELNQVYENKVKK